MKPKHKRLAAAGAAAALAATTLVVGAWSANAGQANHGREIDMQLLAINDFHGHVEASSGDTYPVDGVNVPAGGAEYLAAHLEQAREGERYSTTVAAGDLIGASPFMSAIFDDEPTIESLNAMGVEVSSVGNHEFDAGFDELNRIIEGDEDFEGADFPYLGANVVDEATGKTVLDPYWVKDFGRGVKVGFIGMTLEGTGDIVSKSGIEGLEFRDEVETANKYAKELKRKGVNSIVVLLHEGGVPVAEDTGHDCESLDGSGVGMSGPIVDIAETMTPLVDILVTGHTHQEYVCSVPDPAGNPRMVTSASSYGRVFTQIDATYDRRTKDIVRSSVTGSNTVVTRDVDLDAFESDDAQSDIIAEYGPAAEEAGGRLVGYIAEDITRGKTRAEEFPLGSLIADAQLWNTAGADTGGAEIALLNPGGVRDDLLVDEGVKGEVSYREVFDVQPFNNYVVTLDMTGAQLLKALQQQLPIPGGRSTTLQLQVSEGFTYTWDKTKTGPDQIVAGSLTLNGEPIVADQTYRVTTNSFLAEGGDSFTAFTEGANTLFGELDVDAFEDYIAEFGTAGAPLQAPELGRVTVIS
ncbi:bifunctional metallophosphatase/5'-nucleotidase [Glycomyces algeriensis]|uniref:5'-nucleotidase n=1 Tax=Glycomyces algeriensis TaxID=256037 RepID=A0A9W6G4Z6_9ACTN|nr:5'-nucleotidase C-terminal domain-containing protein [Glycomyces algeriensis]MDA1366862.1 5'-nucleotidase C-terminal domain-containing protein [Glycomyces algeriensis]MDR7352752.1 5'-nucleotidase [Glycomyces algeriensis]GLI40434.1 5'-nucleotidase [Glycomyces algeriensis]